MTDNFWGNVIYSYTRKQAIEDGVLVDVSLMSAGAGLLWPVAVTRRLWDEVIVPSTDGREHAGQSEEGRLWDTLYILRCICARQLRPESEGENVLTFKVFYIRGKRNKLRPVLVKCVLGGDDDGAPCLTLMLPDED